MSKGAVKAAAGDRRVRAGSSGDALETGAAMEQPISELLSKELITAVKEGDEVRVRDVLARGGDSKVTVPIRRGVSLCLVALAARDGRADLLPCLLGAGLSVEGSGTDDRTPLMEAALKGHKTTVGKLLCLGADPLGADKRGLTALHIAAMVGHAGCVSELVAASDVKATGKDGRTPLHWAAWAGCLESVKLLMGKDRRPLITEDEAGNTPLDVATLYGRHTVEAWLTKGSDAVHMDAARYLRLMRLRRDWDKDCHDIVVSWVEKGDVANLKAAIPKRCDGHEMDTDGLTPLHRAAQSGLSPEGVRELLHLGVCPHVLTSEGLTPADLAQREGHKEVLAVLTQHVCGESSSSPVELQDELLSLITQRDDAQKVSRLLCEGVSIEPVICGDSPLRLAVILDRCRTVNLLLACGAILPASLLQDAWQSPDVTSGVLATLKANYLWRLRAERGRLDSNRQSEERRRLLVEGIDVLLKTIESDTPWQAAWPKGKPQVLSALMVEAVHAKCPVTAAFLHRAGAWSFLGGEWGASALATVLEEGHKGMAELLVKHLGSSIYSDVHLLNRIKPEERRRLEQYQLERELMMLENLEIREKSDRGKEAVRQAVQMQQELYDSYVAGRLHEGLKPDAGRSVLQLSVRKGLVQLAYLVLEVGRFSFDERLDDICHTTAFHEAASHGKCSCVALLLGLGADPLLCDRYGQTPRHLAAMFGHKSTEQLLALHQARDHRCRAGTTADQASRNYDAYLQRYEKLGHKERNSLSPLDRHDPERVTRKLMKDIGVQELWQKARQVRVDFSCGEACEVKEAVMKELQTIIKKMALEDNLYSGELKLVGSSEDGSKIYCPDEFDVNFLFTGKDVEVEILETLPKGKGTKTLSVVASAPELQGNNLMDKVFLLLKTCLAEYTLQDERLSFVPPGLSSTQVGVALALAWQGIEYPLLLVGVDLVPVLELPWHSEITVKKLMRGTPKTFHVSNIADGSWRCSFALTEAAVLRGLSDFQRHVFVMGKVLLSCLKTEPWMPQDMKHLCTWYVNREWKIPVTSGFCYKNAFLDWFEENEQVTTPQDAHHCIKALINIFKQLCDDPTEVRGELSPGRISAYFGGEFEGEKVGEGAHLIVRCLEEHLEKE